jgi:hypothetical protein
MLRTQSASNHRVEPAQERDRAEAGRPRGLRRVAREALAVVAGGFGLAVAMTWPALRHPTATLPHDLVDQSLMAWEVRWGAWALFHGPGRLFDGNAFHPERDSYAFSDTLLGYWPLALFGEGPHGAALAVNLIYVFTCALASIGGYALARQLGAGWLGATVAGIALAYAPWRLGHIAHLHVISTGGILLALAMLARGHGFSIRPGPGPGDGARRAGFTPPPGRGHPGWIVGGWLTAAWQMTLGFGVGLAFAYVLAGICVVAVAVWLRRGRPRVPRPMVLANLGGGIVFAAICVLMALPYLRVVSDHPYARRGIAEVGYYSPPLSGYFAGPVESLLWRDDPLGMRASVPLPTEMALLPGLFLILLAALGLRVSVWPRRWRLWLGVAAAATVALGMGIRLYLGVTPYLLLYYLPGWDALRTPGRLVVWTTLLLALLAAGSVTALTDRLGRTATPAVGAVAAMAARGGSRWSATRKLLASARERLRPRLGIIAGALAAGLVLVEGLSVVPHLRIPEPPAALTAEHADTVLPPLLVLPSTQTFDPLVMLWSTDGFPAMVNGLSGFTPASQAEIRAGTYSFPDADSVSLLRRHGVRTVVVLRDFIAGTPWARSADAPVTGLDISRSDIDGAVVFSLG